MSRGASLLSRRSALVLPLALSATTLAACTGDNGNSGEGATADYSSVSDAPASAVLPTDLSKATVELSKAAHHNAKSVIVAPEDQAEVLAPLAEKNGLPFLVGTGDEVKTELSRLAAETLVVPAGFDAKALKDGAEILEVDPANLDAASVPSYPADKLTAPFTLLIEKSEEPSALNTVAKAIVAGRGAKVVETPAADLRTSGETVAAAKDAAGDDPSNGVFAAGEAFGDTEAFIANLTTAVTAPELPGGGQLIVPSRRMIAAYGSPGTPSLGILGEQDLEGAITRTKELAAQYEPYSDLPVVPAFELITTVASASAGADGDYSAELDIATVKEWVLAANEAGIYVVIDLQPGTTDFLTQAKMYEEVLLEPNVGLALDPEWRLKPGQRHLRQIGTVKAAEVNTVIEWLAQLTRENNLPQKALILHQFSLKMITERETIDTSHPELAIILHADGHGTPGAKLDTWRALQVGLPDGIHMAWKNFIDEDTPTFTPEETYNIEPRPWFVSYQ